MERLIARKIMLLISLVCYIIVIWMNVVLVFIFVRVEAFDDQQFKYKCLKVTN